MSGTAPEGPIFVLLVDERAQWLLEGPLRFRFAELGCDVEFERVTEATQAVLIAEKDRHKVAIIVSGTGNPGDERADGRTVISEVRQKLPDAVIVGLWQESSRFPALAFELTEAGADISMHSAQLLGKYSGTPELVSDIYNLLCERQLAPINLRLDKKNEPGIDTAIDDVGDYTLSLLIRSLSGRRTGSIAATLTYVAPGASGAHVMRCEARMPDGAELRWLLKISRDHEALKEELDNGRSVVGRYTAGLIVSYFDVVDRPRRGWAALAMEYADAVPLRSWLCDAGSERFVAPVFEQLFLGSGLASEYGRPVPTDSSQHAIDGLLLPSFRRLRVRESVRQLGALLAHPDGPGLTEAEAQEIVKVIEEFARERRVASVSAVACDNKLVRVNAHGDLHGANVLVIRATDPPRPLVIDLASYKTYHWAMDVARLLVDIVLRCLDSPVDCHFWRRWSQWRTTLKAAASLEAEIPGDERNAAAVAALRWIAGHHRDLMPQLAEPHRRWEWHVAVAEQLLRGTYQPHLPTPKRLLAMAAAHDQLVVASGELAPLIEPTF